MTQVLQETIKPDILSTVPFEHGVHFFTKEDGYTGITATNLSEFASKLETIDILSVLFHYPRGDFQKWIGDTLGDKELADQMCFTEQGLPGEQLRKQLLEMVQKRIREQRRRKLSVRM